MPAAMQPCLSFFAIWSGERRQYWTQNAYGYTPDMDKAGFFSPQEAHQIISSAGEDKQLKLIEYQPSPLRLKLKERSHP
ncbi:hypothetical protein FXF61_00490 [Pseudomonas sp. C27(2019)]|uniref:hypothetical protein n=1 Tax=Pseudomonas sp. C27(2019) TaxID=2604941 RepID=UPI001243AD65|nr:hypothetical protein [Pseudomonas sp. C27(2019)]NLW05496.1 hypothetical protein [Pseudomonadaceae bacterium]QEY57749.1 hypothetical protein FXF61_00490 [Pseudomonas sp. C27(2019)]